LLDCIELHSDAIDPLHEDGQVLHQQIIPLYLQPSSCFQRRMRSLLSPGSWSKTYRSNTQSSERRLPLDIQRLMRDAQSGSLGDLIDARLRLQRPQRRPTETARDYPEAPSSPWTPKSPSIERVNSAPDFLKYTEQNHIPLRACMEGRSGYSCPITLVDFEVGQLVYILNDEVDGMAEGQSVGCISQSGLKELQHMRESRRNGGFRDPLRRTGDRRLTIQNDFSLYTISADPFPSVQNPSEPGPTNLQDIAPAEDPIIEGPLDDEEERVSTSSSHYKPKHIFVVIPLLALLCNIIALTVFSREDEAKTTLL